MEIFNTNRKIIFLNKKSSILKKKYLNFKKTYEKFKIYSQKDIQYRFLRDYFFQPRGYNNFMIELFKKKKFKYKKTKKELLMTIKDLKSLVKNGHYVGLHSHTHPNQLKNLSFKEQKVEYRKNFNFLKSALKIKNISSMSHPSGSYNKDTLKILKSLKLRIGFNSSTNINRSVSNKINASNLEIARVDHANLIKSIK